MLIKIAVTKLFLYHNSLLTVDNLNPARFQTLTKLTELDLSLTAVGRQRSPKLQEMWRNSTGLKILDLKQTGMSQMFPGMFSSLIRLVRLVLNSNYISFIEPTAFQNNSNLEELFIMKNRINSVSWVSFVNLPNLRILGLTDNPLLCTCDVIWIVQTIKNQDIYVPQRPALNCLPPGKWKFRKLSLKLSDCEDDWIEVLKPVPLVVSSSYLSCA